MLIHKENNGLCWVNGSLMILCHGGYYLEVTCIIVGQELSSFTSTIFNNHQQQNSTIIGHDFNHEAWVSLAITVHN